MSDNCEPDNDSARFPDGVIEQKRGNTSIRYRFLPEQLHYSVKMPDVSREFSVGYTAISRDRQTLAERKGSYRLMAMFWLALGSVMVCISILSSNGAAIGTGALWLLLAAGSYAYYRRSLKEYVIVPSDSGNLLILEGETGRKILAEIEQRRADCLRENYDFFPDGESTEQLRERFKWLLSEDAISKDQYAERMNRVDAMQLLAGVSAHQSGKPMEE